MPMNRRPRVDRSEQGRLDKGLTAADATGIYELRMMLEPLLAQRACQHLSRAARPYVSLSMHVNEDIMASNNDEHAALLAAYEAGDADAVYTQTCRHLEHTRDAVVEYVNQWAAESQLQRKSG
jgi:DNA-binding GntR family transcriptional regulator